MGEERRKYPRVNSHFSVEVRPAKVKRVAETQNVSQGGILFEHGEKVEVGAILDLSLRVPSLSGLTEIKGKVVRCEPIGNERFAVAINFVNTTAETEASIKEMLSSF